MNYFIIVFLIIFPVFSFSTELESKLVQKAETGDVEALVQLYEFYRDNRMSEKADSALNRAAEKGHIPSLKLVYQQTGKILSVGVEAAVNTGLFAPFIAYGERTKSGAMDFSDMDHLPSINGLEGEVSKVKRSIISQITDGKKSSLVEKSKMGDGMPLGQPVRPTMMELRTEKDGSFRLLEPGHEVNGGYLFPPPSLKKRAAEETQEGIRVMYEQTQTRDRLKGDNPVSLTVMEYVFSEEVTEEFKARYEQTGAKEQLSIDDFILRMLTARSLIPEPTENEAFQLLELKMEVGGKYHLEKIDSLEMLNRYAAYRLENNKTQMEYWLSRLKSLANTGDISALQIVYHITGEVLVTGLNAAVDSTMDNSFAEGREKGVSPKITTVKDREEMRNNIVARIKKAPFGNCKGAF